MLTRSSAEGAAAAAAAVDASAASVASEDGRSGRGSRSPLGTTRTPILMPRSQTCNIDLHGGQSCSTHDWC